MCRLAPRGCNVVLSVPALRCTRVLSARSCQRQGRRDGIWSLGHKLRKPQTLMVFFFPDKKIRLANPQKPKPNDARYFQCI